MRPGCPLQFYLSLSGCNIFRKNYKDWHGGVLFVYDNIIAKEYPLDM